MALVVEDGSGLSTAESYLSVADADTYHAAHSASTTWSGADTSDKENALRVATQYLDVEYGIRWQGLRGSSTQALDWPRSNVEVDGFLLSSTSLPTELKSATAEMALRQLSSPIIPDVSDPMVIEESVKVDVIEESKKYAGPKTKLKQYTIVEKLIRRLLVQTTKMVRH